MTKIEKKEIFLQILENWFNDYSQDINQDNCIGFYKHFTLSLKFESNIFESNIEGRNLFLKSTLDILDCFDTIIENNLSPHDLVITKKALYKISEKCSTEFDVLFSELYKIYDTSKKEYLLK